MLDAQMMERAKLTQEGMAQFELLHAPVKAPSQITSPNGQESADMELVVCRTCRQDFPCARMGNMLIVQGLAMFQSMLPTGGISGALGRFASGGR